MSNPCRFFHPLLIRIALPALFFFVALPASPQERFRRSPPYPEPFPVMTPPEVQTHILSNGLNLAVVRRKNQPTMSLRLVILTGESASPDALPGLATLTARMLARGTVNFSADKFDESVESMGGSFSVETFPDYSLFTFSFLEDYLDQALSLLSEMVLFPTFPRSEIEDVQRSMFYNLAVQSQNPEFLSRRLLLQILFENHPYRKIIYRQGEIKNLGRRDITAFYEQHYRPNNAALVLVGNITLEAASRSVSRYLNAWRPREGTPSALPVLEARKEERICFINFPQARDATITMGNVLFPATSPDAFPFLVLNQVIGGTSNSRLFMHLRESKGYAYYAFSELAFFRSGSVFLVRTRVRTEVCFEAIREILKEIESATRRRIPSQDIEQAKSYLVGNFPLTIERNAQLSQKIAEIQAFHLGGDRWDRYVENIMRINPETVYQTGRKYPLLTPVIVIVGNSEVIDFLKEFDEVHVYDTDGIYQYTITKGVKE